MAIRVRYTIEAAISSDTTEQRDIANTRFTLLNDKPSDGASFRTVLAASATDVPVLFPNIAAASLVIIRTTCKDPTQALPVVKIRKNSISGEQISIAPLTGSREGHFLLSTDSITGIWATNMSSSVDVNLQVIICGD